MKNNYLKLLLVGTCLYLAVCPHFCGTKYQVG